jgi:hypothetical protein
MVAPLHIHTNITTMEGTRTGPRERASPGLKGLPYEVNLKDMGVSHPFVVFEGEKGPCCSTLHIIKQVHSAVRYDFTRIFIASELVIV